MKHVREDLEAQGLGSYDEWKAFYVTVPGGIETVSAWMDFDEWQRDGCRAA